MLEECDDQVGHSSGSRFCAVAADGATEGLLNGRWAKTLVDAFTAELPRDVESVHRCLAGARKSWVDTILAYRRDRENRGRPIQWYEEPGLETGSFSTLLYLTADNEKSLARPARMKKRRGGVGKKKVCAKHWRAFVVGDSCLLFVPGRGGHKVLAFPLTTSLQFNSSPNLISSRSAQADQTLRANSGEWCPGDRVYLMTDVISCWTLRQLESGRQPWPEIDEGLRGEEAFQRLLTTLRTEHTMRNDDVSVVRVSL